MRPHALRADLFGCLDRETERILVERKRLVDVLNGDADVIENGGTAVGAAGSRPTYLDS